MSISRKCELTFESCVRSDGTGMRLHTHTHHGLACTCFEWPAFLDEHPPSVEQQYQALEDWTRAREQKIASERRKSWREYVKDMWARSPKKIYKWIRRTAAVWDILPYCMRDRLHRQS
eukprot:198681-Amphidinium_carterae.2